MDNSIIEKVRKLFALAQSSNENEASLASMKAKEILDFIFVKVYYVP